MVLAATVCDEQKGVAQDAEREFDVGVKQEYFTHQEGAAVGGSELIQTSGRSSSRYTKHVGG